MAKTGYNPFSRWSGRVGGNVFKVINGSQVVMPYSGVSNDRKSPAQLEVRARFSFSHKLSKIIPFELLAGIKGNKDTRRKELISRIYRNSAVSVDDKVYSAYLYADELVISDGDVFYYDITNLALADGTLTGDIRNIPDGIDRIMVMAMCSNAEGEYTSCVYTVVAVRSGAATINLRVGGFASGSQVQVYTVPLTLTMVGANQLAGKTFADESTAENFYVLMLKNEGNYQWGRSVYGGSVTLT